MLEEGKIITNRKPKATTPKPKVGYLGTKPKTKMSKASTHTSYLIIITVLVAVISMHMHDRADLKVTANDRREEIELLEKQVEQLQDENNIFTSMLGEIENESGGHEILEKLYNEFNGSTSIDAFAKDE